MKENYKIAAEFAGEASKVKGVLLIALFGSVARGEDTRESDIDIAIMHNLPDDRDLIKQLTKIKHDKIKLTFKNIKELAEETELVGALSGEGIILYGRPMIIGATKLKLSPKIIVCYSMDGLSQTEKVKLDRALYGSVSKCGEYVTKTKGITSEAGIEKLAKCVLLADRKKSKLISFVLKRFKAHYTIKNIWTY